MNVLKQARQCREPIHGLASDRAALLAWVGVREADRRYTPRLALSISARQRQTRALNIRARRQIQDRNLTFNEAVVLPFRLAETGIVKS